MTLSGRCGRRLTSSMCQRVGRTGRGAASAGPGGSRDRPGRRRSRIPPGEALVVGEPVNTAARVPPAADPGAVLVDDVTREVTSASIVFEDAGERSVGGRAGRVRMWRAVRVVAGVGGAQRDQSLEASFVGREADLRLLNELFHGALERRSARLVAVSGDAGIGKSRLRWEFMKHTDGLAQRFLWHSGRCPPFGDGIAYWPLAEMIRQRLGIAEDASPADASTKLVEGLDRWVADATHRAFLLPRLGALLGLAEPGFSAPSCSPAGGCSSSSSRPTSRCCWCSRICTGPISACSTSSSICSSGRPRARSSSSRSRGRISRCVTRGGPPFTADDADTARPARRCRDRPTCSTIS